MGTPKKITPEAVDPLRSEFRGVSQDLAGYTKDILSTRSTPYTGQRFADFSPEEQTALNRVLNMGNGNPFDGLTTKYVNDVMSGSRLTPDSNPFLNTNINAVRAAGMDTLGDALDMVDSAFGRSGLHIGSGRNGAVVDTTRKVTGDINNTIAQLLGDNYNRGTAEQMSVFSALPSWNSGNLNNALSILGASSMPRQLEQNKLDFNYNEFLRMLQEPMTRAQTVAQILGGVPGYNYAAPSYRPSNTMQFFNALSDVGNLLRGVGSVAAA